MGALLAGEKLSKVLKGEIEVTLVDRADIEINTGEFVSITGPSGSGKSSLLYLLGLLDKPSAGRVIVAGQDTSQLDDGALAALRLRNIGFIFQFHFLLPEFTALENVMLPMQRLGQKAPGEMRDRAEQLLTDLGLAAQAKKLPKQMSGGQAQRVAIARALANDPLLILADEPTGNLDTASAENVQQILRDIAHENSRAVVAVTHDMAFARIADRNVHIVDGRIQKN